MKVCCVGVDNEGDMAEQNRAARSSRSVMHPAVQQAPALAAAVASARETSAAVAKIAALPRKGSGGGLSSPLKVYKYNGQAAML